MQNTGYRGRGRGRGGFQQFPPRTSVALPPTRNMMDGLNAIIGTLDKDTLSFVKGVDSSAPAGDLKEIHRGEVTFDDVRPLGSYNWTNAPAKILVPGKDASMPCNISSHAIRKRSDLEEHCPPIHGQE
jgi:hypothetical protein